MIEGESPPACSRIYLAETRHGATWRRACNTTRPWYHTTYHHTLLSDVVMHKRREFASWRSSGAQYTLRPRMVLLLRVLTVSYYDHTVRVLYWKHLCKVGGCCSSLRVQLAATCWRAARKKQQQHRLSVHRFSLSISAWCTLAININSRTQKRTREVVNCTPLSLTVVMLKAYSLMQCSTELACTTATKGFWRKALSFCLADPLISTSTQQQQ